ncbi:hypothetical protein GCM10011512_28850 [Tersicoccus solisilvae]|uniref:HTH tetR-type domain-containing protein n=1 Tax=Tersicoccus solisilvae TaxID=1882339 RepID=A0ABQ1PNR9_9MICC|nr:helix-turn-helix domain-containing protein [Tersicoccus solisilvae]GGD00232.1 hypothetical protein GCM10011512_28850 [Tersicoccus solisilvae]
MPTPEARVRDGAATRRRALHVALDLFTRQGYGATSLRQIAEELGITKASLYYHFPRKDAILQAILQERGTEAEDVLAWLRAQPPPAAALEPAVLRWVESSSAEKLRGIRFLQANPLVADGLAGTGAERIGTPLATLADELVALVPHPAPEDALLLRMALLSINAAVAAAAQSDVDDDVVLAAARRSARALVRELLADLPRDEPREPPGVARVSPGTEDRR